MMRFTAFAMLLLSFVSMAGCSDTNRFESEIAQLKATNDTQRKEIAALDAKLADANKANERLQMEVTSLVEKNRMAIDSLDAARQAAEIFKVSDRVSERRFRRLLSLTPGDFGRFSHISSKLRDRNTLTVFEAEMLIDLDLGIGIEEANARLDRESKDNPDYIRKKPRE